MLAETTGSPVPSAEALRRLAGTLGGFPEKVIDSACYALEAAPQGEFRRMPSPYDLEKACKSVTDVKVTQTRWCGRCTLGMIRGSDNEIQMCQCNCLNCNNSGYMTESRKIHNYASEVGFAMRCPKGCRITGSEAA